MKLELATSALLAVAACHEAKGPPAAASTKAVVRDAGAAVAPPAEVITDVTHERYAMPPLPRGRVTLTDAFKGRHVVEVEVAHTNPQRTRGLMWRKALEPGQGMLFLFPRQQWLSFWMRNTLIPLDMVFIDADLKVVGVVTAEPLTLESRSPGGESQFVLEVPKGWAAAQGIGPGATVKLEGVAELPVQP